MTWWTLIALAACTVVGIALFRLWSSRKWTPTEGRVLIAELQSTTVGRSVITQSDVYTTEHVLNLKYEYTVGGVPYTGDRLLASGPNVFSQKEDAQVMLNRFPAGSRVTVHYAPEDPARSCLVSGSAIPVKVFFGIAAMLLIVVAIGGVAVLLATGKLTPAELLEKFGPTR